MSAPSTWLHGQRKTELVDLADKVGLKDYDNLKKAELETALDEHMRANQARLSKDSSLSAFFKRVNASPTKKDPTKETTGTETKTPKRKPSKAKEDGEGETSTSGSSNTALMRSPAQKLAVASNVPLPPSPAAVASHIDRQAAKVRSGFQKAYKQSGIHDYVDNVRDKVSTTASIETIALAIELIGLRVEILPWKYLSMIPASRTLHTPEIPIKVPDLFVLLSADFWSTFLLWFITSAVLPMAFAYFFNLTLKAKHGHMKHAKNVAPSAQYDSLTFNLSKGLIMWLIYGKNVTLFGWPGDRTKAKIDYSVPGGYQGVLVATGIGALTSVYEAVLKK